MDAPTPYQMISKLRPPKHRLEPDPVIVLTRLSMFGENPDGTCAVEGRAFSCVCCGGLRTQGIAAVGHDPSPAICTPCVNLTLPLLAEAFVAPLRERSGATA